MNHNNFLEKIIIIDYGSQFTQLIARKVRELGVYSEIINSNQIRRLKKNKSIKGIILSGGPLTITNKNSSSLIIVF
jgi:GMP synthase (glutamine-hydrolysing)